MNAMSSVRKNLELGKRPETSLTAGMLDEEFDRCVKQIGLQTCDEEFRKKKVTYTLEHDGHFYLVENVPARISPETGEQFFSPETVQRLQSFIFQKQEPKKVVQTPVFEFAV
jgi:YgiT-type zinc finger domain-containing protein